MKAEDFAIMSLRNAAGAWPKDKFWVWAADDRLYLMRCGENGERVRLPNGGVDPGYVEEAIDIPADGGDW